ncbi:UNVERIFIED_CONTAM: hypothetical protein PYX00_006134 [Menopon gallinae]|uniref:Uncharacterized protein n=1 Tax=Menopon gallinae TaxID=328185 RepID=A0AAW2HU80_9NEOP
MASVKVPEQKVILCGEFGVGKSSLFRRFATNTFVTGTDRKSTLGLDHYDKPYQFDGRTIKLQLWDTGGLERVASVTSSYYKFAEAAILHLLDIVAYAENAKIFLCGNKSDLVVDKPQVTESDIENFCEECHNLISSVYKTSCKTAEGVEEMFADIARQLVESNRSRIDLKMMDADSFKVTQMAENPDESSCLC